MLLNFEATWPKLSGIILWRICHPDFFFIKEGEGAAELNCPHHWLWLKVLSNPQKVWIKSYYLWIKNSDWILSNLQFELHEDWHTLCVTYYLSIHLLTCLFIHCRQITIGEIIHEIKLEWKCFSFHQYSWIFLFSFQSCFQETAFF